MRVTLQQLFVSCVAGLVLAPAALFADGDEKDGLAGHSLHSEAFNEGPRQKAYLMEGTGKVNFPVTTKSSQVQKFFNQGVGQLHGFWYFEAERSFRQAAALDTNCAAAYWGIAMANVNNLKRGTEFIQVAVKHKVGASAREVMWINALANYYDRTDKKKTDKERRGDYATALENISKAYPNDIEAKAFWALQLWDNSSKGIAITNRAKVDDLLNQVLAAEPMHPVHHYRIHLWNNQNDKLALNSAANCGQSSTDIAHMWHMPGHTYSKLYRYDDAAWHQEASARVDHWNMMHDRVLPDQIHNYAHNNEWLIRDLSFIGRARHGIDLAKNLIELPRHPKYNHLNKNGSATYGRERLLDMLVRYELWDELIALNQTVYLEPTTNSVAEADRLRDLGVAYFNIGDAKRGGEQIVALEALAKTLPKSTRPARPATNAVAGSATNSVSKGTNTVAGATNAVSPAARALTMTENGLAELRGWEAMQTKDFAKARTEFAKSKDLTKERLAQIYWQMGDQQKALDTARDALKASTNQVQVLATYVDLHYRAGKYDAAFKAFYDLKRVSSQIELDLPVFQRLAPVAADLGLAKDWREPYAQAADTGKRPGLNKLGPYRWTPTAAPEFSLPDSEGKSFALKKYRGKPVIVIFYLGYGCAHCVQQLSAFVPATKGFNDAGISLVAVSTDTVAGLQKTFGKMGQPDGLPFPLVSDTSLKTFKAFRAYDDFEKMPLHGTFLIDGEGLVRWHDISYEPFTETKFLLEESKRLLGLPKDRDLRSGKLAGRVSGGKSE